VTFAVLFLGCNKSSVNSSQWVNRLLGEISYESTFGHKPDAITHNTLRIGTHLEYVAHLLRNKRVSPALRSVPIHRFSHGIFPHLYKGLIAETIEAKKSIRESNPIFQDIDFNQ
jgi:hypothetical protein